jgi:hypothetical protein
MSPKGGNITVITTQSVNADICSYLCRQDRIEITGMLALSNVDVNTY